MAALINAEYKLINKGSIIITLRWHIFDLQWLQLPVAPTCLYTFAWQIDLTGASDYNVSISRYEGNHRERSWYQTDRYKAYLPLGSGEWAGMAEHPAAFSVNKLLTSMTELSGSECSKDQHIHSPALHLAHKLMQLALNSRQQIFSMVQYVRYSLIY